MADNMPLVARIMVQHGGDGPPGGPGVADGGAADGGEGKETAKNTKAIAKATKASEKGIMANLGKTMGINVGISSILKQSQVFTGYIGTIFQLMGALVDVILAPFLPILIPAIKLLASFIPIASNLMKGAFGVLNFIWKYIVIGFKLVNKHLLGWLPNIAPTIVKGVKYIIMSLILGAFFIKLFNMQKLARASGKAIAMSSLTMLRVIAANTAMGGKATMGGNAAAAASRGKMLKTSIRGFGRFAAVAVLITAMGGILMRGFNMLGDKHDMNNANQNRNMEGLTRLERSNKDTTEQGSSNVIASVATGLGAVHGGLAVGNLALRGLGPTISRGWGRLMNLGRRQGRNALGRFTKNQSMWGRLGTRAGIASAAIRDRVIAMKDRVVGAFNDKFPKVGTKITEMKTALGKKIGTLGTDIKGFFGNLGNRLGGLLNKIPGVKTATKLVKGGFDAAKGFLFGKGGADVGKLGKLGKFAKGALFGARAIPVLGSIAEAAYGTYKTYKSFKDYGAKAGFARMGVSAAATVGAFFDPSGLASATGSVLGHEGLSYLERKGSMGEYRGGNGGQAPGGPSTIIVVRDSGIGTAQESNQIEVQEGQNAEITLDSSRPPMYRSGMGGY